MPSGPLGRHIFIKNVRRNPEFRKFHDFPYIYILPINRPSGRYVKADGVRHIESSPYPKTIVTKMEFVLLDFVDIFSLKMDPRGLWLLLTKAMTKAMGP